MKKPKPGKPDLIETFREFIIKLGTLVMVLVRQGIIDPAVWAAVDQEYRATLAVDKALDPDTKAKLEGLDSLLRSLRRQDRAGRIGN